MIYKYQKGMDPQNNIHDLKAVMEEFLQSEIDEESSNQTYYSVIASNSSMVDQLTIQDLFTNHPSLPSLQNEGKLSKNKFLKIVFSILMSRLKVESGQKQIKIVVQTFINVLKTSRKRKQMVNLIYGFNHQTSESFFHLCEQFQIGSELKPIQFKYIKESQRLMGVQTIKQIKKSAYRYILRREGVENNEEFKIMMKDLIEKIQKGVI